MKRFFLGLAICVAAVFGLLLVSGLIAKSLVSGSGKNGLISSLSETLGVPLSVASADFDLAQWLRLKPSISLETVTAGNPPGFRSKNLLQADRISAQVFLLPLLQRKIEVRAITVERPRITVESNAQGTTNLETLLKKASAGKAGAAKSGSGGRGANLAIDELSLHNGQVTMTGSGASDLAGLASPRDINLRLEDFGSDRSCRLDLSAKLFGGSNSKVHLAAKAGPLGADSLPLDGKLSVTIAPGEIPAAVRRKLFGMVFGAPGEKGRASLEASVKGDAYRSLAGPAKITFSDILIGKDEKHVLALSGEAPLVFTGSRLMSSPSIEVRMPGGKLRLGKGEWSGSGELAIRGPAISGSSRGAVRGVEINELASSLTSASEKIYGVLEVPSYSVRFAGKNAEEMRDSLSGAGSLAVKNGKIAALDLLSSIEHALQRSQQETDAAKGSTAFENFTTSLNIGERRMDLTNILLDGPALHASGKGVIGFDQAIHFDLDVRVGGTLARALNAVSLASQSGEANVPVAVTGTVEAPKVRPNAGKVATNAVKGILGSFFGKKQ